MPKGYIYAELEVTDPALFETYRPLAAASIAAFGGRYAVRGGDPLGRLGRGIVRDVRTTAVGSHAAARRRAVRIRVRTALVDVDRAR